MSARLSTFNIQLSGEGHGAAAEELWPVGTASQITRGPGDNTGMKV